MLPLHATAHRGNTDQLPFVLVPKQKLLLFVESSKGTPTNIELTFVFGAWLQCIVVWNYLTGLKKVGGS